MPTGIYKRIPRKFSKREIQGLIERNKKRKGEKRSKETRLKMRLAHLGIKKGPFTEEHKKKLSESHKGIVNTEFQKKKISLALKGRPAHNKGKKMSLAMIEKNRKWHINNPNRKFKDTSIELKIEAELKNRNIIFEKQKPIYNVAIVDFFLPQQNIVIECDGDYWHNLYGRKERDAQKTSIMEMNGYKVFRFWGSEINKSAKNCVDKIF